ncbi:MAG: hypothetical protein FJY07_12550 [Bacteroidetes bacterium]|nr:hypothetical protein [Bacteroidota bacterium]
MVYYVIAILYKIFGPYDFIFRIFNALLLFLGFFYLFKTAKIFFQDKFWALMLPAILFTSPTLAYYGNSFMPDTSALGLVFIAIYYVVKYSNNPKVKFLYIASGLYALAGLLKISSLLSFFGILTTIVFCSVFSKEFRTKYKLLHLIIPALIPMVSVIIWYYIVHYYNTHFGASISPVEIRPIWRLDEETIIKTFTRIKKEWLTSYFSYVVHIVTLICLISTLFFFKKTNRFISIFSIFTLLGAIFFFLFFFRSMYQHDYYMINNFIAWMIILFNGLLLLKKTISVIYNSWISKALFILIIVFSTIKAEKIINFNYKGYHNTWHKVKFRGLEGIEKINRGLGIKPDDLVISIPDESNNISLYLMNQPGFNDFGFTQMSGTKRIKFFINKGAKYLFICDTSIYKKKEYKYLDEYTDFFLLRHRNIDIYDLKPYINEK